MTHEDAEELRRLCREQKIYFAALQAVAHADVPNGIRKALAGYNAAEAAFEAKLASLVEPKTD